MKKTCIGKKTSHRDIYIFGGSIGLICMVQAHHWHPEKSFLNSGVGGELIFIIKH